MTGYILLFGGFDHAREQQGGIVDVDTSLYTKKRGAGQNPTSLRTDMETFKKPDPYNRVGVWEGLSMAKRFVGHCVTHEGTMNDYRAVMHKLYCNLEKCPPDKKNCYCCDNAISEVSQS